jgi:peptide/nickel transport system permease protein
LGLLEGSVAGFFGGVIDESLMRLVDIFLSIPQILFPRLVLFLFAISVNFLSDGLRDALDPRLRR